MSGRWIGRWKNIICVITFRYAFRICFVTYRHPPLPPATHRYPPLLPRATWPYRPLQKCIGSKGLHIFIVYYYLLLSLFLLCFVIFPTTLFLLLYLLFARKNILSYVFYLRLLTNRGGHVGIVMLEARNDTLINLCCVPFLNKDNLNETK